MKCQLHFLSYVNLLSANFTKWSNRTKQFVGKLPPIGAESVNLLVVC